MTTVISTPRDADDHAFPRLAPVSGPSSHRKASLAATPAVRDTDRTSEFRQGSDPSPELRSPLGHFSSCPGCRDQDDSMHDAATARTTRVGRQQIEPSRKIEGPE